MGLGAAGAEYFIPPDFRLGVPGNRGAGITGGGRAGDRGPPRLGQRSGRSHPRPAATRLPHLLVASRQSSRALSVALPRGSSPRPLSRCHQRRAFPFGEVILSAVARAGVIAVFAIPLSSVLTFEALLLVATGFHHSDLRLPPGLERALSWIVVTPSIHWVHHHRIRSDTDSNYSTILSLWDRLFASRSATRRILSTWKSALKAGKSRICQDCYCGHLVLYSNWHGTLINSFRRAAPWAKGSRRDWDRAARRSWCASAPPEFSRLAHRSPSIA